MDPLRKTIIRNVMRKNSVNYATAKKFVDGAVKAIETRLLNGSANEVIKQEAIN